MSFLSKRTLLYRGLVWFLGGNTLLFWLIGLRYIAVIIPFELTIATPLNTIGAWTFLIIAYIGQMAMLVSLLAIIPLIGLLLIPNRALIIANSVLITSLAILLLLVDTTVFTQYHFHLNRFILALLTSGYAKEIFDFSQREYLWLTLIALGIILLESSYATISWKVLAKKKIVAWYWLSPFCLLLISYYLLLLSIRFIWLLSLNQQAAALPLYHTVLASLLGDPKAGWRLERSYRSDFIGITPTQALLRYPLKPLQCRLPLKPLNIVFILIDTWRFDMLNATVTPNINRFAQQSWQFQQHFSGGNSTQAGIFSLFYSLPATYWPATIHQHKGPIFIETLLKFGYQFGVFASAQLHAPPFNQNVFIDVKNLQVKTPGANPFARDRYITDAFKHFITRTQQPFFSVIFYDSAHSFCADQSLSNHFQPSIKTCNRIVLNKRSDPTLYFNRYKNALYFIDQLIQESLVHLRQHHLLGNTIVVITGDHGIEFNDNHLGYWGHAGNFTRYQIQTPLVVYWPGEKPAVFNHPTSHYDIIPTLLTHLFACKNPPIDYSLGKLLGQKNTLPYLLVSNYVEQGIVEKDKTTLLFPSGHIEIQTPTAQRLPITALDTQVMLDALADTKRYYQTPIDK